MGFFPAFSEQGSGKVRNLPKKNKLKTSLEVVKPKCLLAQLLQKHIQIWAILYGNPDEQQIGFQRFKSLI